MFWKYYLHPLAQDDAGGPDQVVVVSCISSMVITAMMLLTDNPVYLCKVFGVWNLGIMLTILEIFWKTSSAKQ